MLHTHEKLSYQRSKLAIIDFHNFFLDARAGKKAPRSEDAYVNQHVMKLVNNDGLLFFLILCRMILTGAAIINIYEESTDVNAM